MFPIFSTLPRNYNTNIASSYNEVFPCKNGNYLYKGVPYWTISPYSGMYSINIWSVSVDGDIFSTNAAATNDVYPVTHLAPNFI